MGRLRDLEVPDAVTACPRRADAEDRHQKLGSFWADLRHVERQRHTPWQRTIALSTDGNVETSLSVDESRYVVTEVERDCFQPVWRAEPFLLIVRTGRIVTAHASPSHEGVTGTSTAGFSGFPANSGVCSRELLLESRNCPYGRRLPGLR